MGAYSSWSTLYEIGQGARQLWKTGDWGGFFDTAIGAFNKNFNPFYAIGTHGYFAYVSGQSHDWRSAFKHGTVATILTILAVVTAGKGISGALKKGNGAIALDVAEEASTKKAMLNPHGKLGGRRLGRAHPAFGGPVQ